MSKKLDTRIRYFVEKDGVDIPPDKLLGILIEEGSLDQETINKISRIGPLEEWITMKIQRLQAEIANLKGN